jgi:hypothetical protein
MHDTSDPSVNLDPLILVPFVGNDDEFGPLGCSCGQSNGQGSGGGCKCGSLNGGGQ